MKTTYFNRYGDNIQFELISENEIEMTGHDSSFMRYGYDGDESNKYDNLVFIDPPGGPFLSTGTDLGRYFDGKIDTHFIHKITLKDKSVLFTTKSNKFK